MWNNTAWKVSKHGVFSDPYFPVFGLSTEIYGSLFFTEFTEFFQSEYRKIWPRKTPYLDTFHAVKTGQLLSDYIGEIVLLFYDGGKGKYIDHRQERDNRKGSKISDTIRKVNYPSFLFPAAEAAMKQKNSKNGYSRRQNLN